MPRNLRDILSSFFFYIKIIVSSAILFFSSSSEIYTSILIIIIFSCNTSPVISIIPFFLNPLVRRGEMGRRSRPIEFAKAAEKRKERNKKRRRERFEKEREGASCVIFYPWDLSHTAAR